MQVSPKACKCVLWVLAALIVLFGVVPMALAADTPVEPFFSGEWTPLEVLKLYVLSLIATAVAYVVVYGMTHP